MKTIQEIITFDCPSHAFYEAFMTRSKHGEFTHSPVIIEPKVGGKYSAYNGDLIGSFTKLVPDELIAMNWRCVMDGWPKDHFSIVTMELFQSSQGTELEFLQTDIPDTCFEAIKAGWHDFYWGPMEEYIAR